MQVVNVRFSNGHLSGMRVKDGKLFWEYRYSAGAWYTGADERCPRAVEKRLVDLFVEHQKRERRG